MSALLMVQQLSIQFGQQTVVNNISFSLEAGKTLALVGESGSGKSVTALSILGLLAKAQCQGEILFDGKNLLALEEKALQAYRGKHIAMIFQEPMSALNPLKTIDKQIAECLPDYAQRDKSQCQQQVLQLLEQVQLEQPEQRYRAYPHQLSGGQRQRVMIAMAIAKQPDLLIADEPTTALDVSIAQEILALLKSLQQRYNMAILFISHDLRSVRQIADDIAIMQAGQMIEKNTCQAFFAHPQHAYSQSLLHIPLFEKNPVNSQQVVLSAEHLSVNFALPKRAPWQKTPYFHALQSISFKLHQGENLAIVGQSGSGKSTLAKALLQLLPYQGQVVLNGQPLNGLKAKALRPLRQQLQVVFQDPFASLSPRMTIEQIIAEGLYYLKKLDTAQCQAQVIQAMQEVDLDPSWRFRYAHELSGGQRQRVAIARALVMQASCIILDEPTSALDKNVQYQVLQLLLRLQRQHGISYIFISHDIALLQRFCHYFLVIKDGKIIEQGDNESLFQQPQQAYTQQLIQASVS